MLPGYRSFPWSTPNSFPLYIARHDSLVDMLENVREKLLCVSKLTALFFFYIVTISVLMVWLGLGAKTTWLGFLRSFVLKYLFCCQMLRGCVFTTLVFVTMNTVGNCLRFPLKYPVVSHLQMLKCSLEMRSLSWQHSCLLLPHRPLYMTVVSWTCKVNMKWHVLHKCNYATKAYDLDSFLNVRLSQKR